MPVAAISTAEGEQPVPDGGRPAATASSGGPPGADDRCIGDALEHALGQIREMLREEREGGETRASNFSRESLADVDGDAKPEVLLVEGYIGTANNPHVLYLSDSGCLRYGGVIWAHAESIQVLPDTKNGIRMLRAFGSNGCAGLAGAVMHLTWDEDHYAVTRRIECGCPDDKREKGRDPACP